MAREFSCDAELTTLLGGVNTELRQMLPDTQSAPLYTLALRLVLFGHVAALDTVAWMSYLVARTPLAEDFRPFLVRDLRFKAEHDYPQAVDRFLAQMAEPVRNLAQLAAPHIYQQRLISPVASLHQLLREGNLLEAFIAWLIFQSSFWVLEPWLREAGHRLGVEDMDYLRKFHAHSSMQVRTDQLKRIVSVMAQRQGIVPLRLYTMTTPVKGVRVLFKNIFGAE